MLGEQTLSREVAEGRGGPGALARALLGHLLAAPQLPQVVRAARTSLPASSYAFIHLCLLIGLGLPTPACGYVPFVSTWD